MTRSLVEAAQRGDHGAFEALAIARVDRLYGGALLILRDVHLAEDAVQETLIRAWQQLPRLRDVDKLDAWVHRLLVNSCADQGRSRMSSRKKPRTAFWLVQSCSGSSTAAAFVLLGG